VTFARHWFHSEHLLVEGTTMSKSKGNYYTLSDLVGKGHSPMAVRYALLSGHPRKQLNFTLEGLDAAIRTLESLDRSLLELMQKAGISPPSFRQSLGEPFDRNWASFNPAWEIIRDDLNLPAALGEIHTALRGILRLGASKFPPLEDLRAFAAMMERVIGVRFFSQAEPLVASDVKALAEKRWAAKQAKDFAKADALRQELAAAGWSMLDGKDSYKLEPAKK
jgi:cysteinyl-tRNA synthetase